MTDGGPGGSFDASDPDANEHDLELLKQHLAGDPNAFTEIVRRHRDHLWAVALRTTGDPEDAADALQDGLISAMRHAASLTFLPSPPPPGPPRDGDGEANPEGNVRAA